MKWIYSVYQYAIQNPKTRWVVIVATVIYLFSPIDVLPEAFLFVFGLLDDGIILSMLIAELTKLNRRKKEGKNADAEIDSDSI